MEIYNGIKLTVGYSPENLQALMTAYNIKKATVYRHIGRVRSHFERYLLPVSNDQHITMAHADWLKVLELIEQTKTEKVEQLRAAKRKRDTNRMRQAAHMMQVNELRKQGKAGTRSELKPRN